MSTIPLDLPEVYIELFGSMIANPGGYNLTTPWAGFHPLDPADYDGDVTFEFEVIGANKNTSPADINLVDSSGATYATIMIPAGTSGPTGYELHRLPRESFVPGAGERLYGVQIIGASEWYDYEYGLISAARIVIRQNGATRSRIQIPLVGSGLDNLGQNYYPDLNYDPGGLAYVDPVYGYTRGTPLTRYPLPEYTNAFPGIYPETRDGAMDAVYNSDRQLTLWRFSADELDTVSRVVFRAMAGAQAASPVTRTNDIIASVSMDAWRFGLYTSITGLGACASATPTGFGAPSYVDDCTGDTFTYIPGSETRWDTGDPYPTTVYALPDLSGLTGTVGIYVGGCINDGPWGHFAQWFSLTIPEGQKIVEASLSMQFYDNGGRTKRDVKCTLKYQFAPAEMDLYLALFNATDGVMVEGSELHFDETDRLKSWKSAELSPTSLQEGKEYELRAMQGGATLLSSWTWMVYADAELLINVDPIVKFTSWQRVTHRRLKVTSGWRSATAWGTGTYGYACANIGSRVLLYSPEDAVVRFEATGFVHSYNYDPGNPQMFSIWLRDAVEDDYQGYGSQVEGSELHWEAEELDARIRKRTEPLALTQGNRYIDWQASGDTGWLEINNGFIMITVEGEENGNGEPPDPPGEGLQPINPWVILEWSDDGGFTWSNEYWRSPGRAGEHRTRVRWNRLGASRDRMFMIIISDPIKVAIMGAYIEASPGDGR